LFDSEGGDRYLVLRCAAIAQCHHLWIIERQATDLERRLSSLGGLFWYKVDSALRKPGSLNLFKKINDVHIVMV
jgi:hypothetical protein